MSIFASVVMKQSIVAMFGSIIPAPLAMPPRRTVFPSISNSTATSLGKVSLVMIASAACRLPWLFAAAGNSAMEVSIFSIGSGTPMRPVEQTMTWRDRNPRALAVASAMRLAFSMPATPVQALAFPAFAMMARASPDRRCIIDTRTGAALTRFVVNVPATTVSCGEWISAMSGLLLLAALMPQ